MFVSLLTLGNCKLQFIKSMRLAKISHSRFWRCKVGVNIGDSLEEASTVRMQ